MILFDKVSTTFNWQLDHRVPPTVFKWPFPVYPVIYSLCYSITCSINPSEASCRMLKNDLHRKTKNCGSVCEGTRVILFDKVVSIKRLFAFHQYRHGALTPMLTGGYFDQFLSHCCLVCKVLLKSGVNQTFVCFSSVSSWRLIWMAPNSMGMLTGSCCNQFQSHCCLLCVMLGQCNFVNGNCHMSQNGWIITILYI